MTRFFALSLLLCATGFAAKDINASKISRQPLPANNLGTVPIGTEISVRMRDSELYWQVRLIAVDHDFLRVAIREEYYTLAYGTQYQDKAESLPRQKVFRAFGAGKWYSDLPMTDTDHMRFDNYVDFAMARGDIVETHDGHKYMGFVTSESDIELIISMSEGSKPIYRNEIRACRIRGKICDAPGYLVPGYVVPGVIASAKGSRNFTEALEAAMPADAKGKSFGVSSFQNASSNKTADAMAASLKSKAVAHLTALGYRVTDRETLASVLKEKQLSQQGVLAGNDKTLDQAAQNDYIISGNLESGGSGNYQVVINVVSTRSLAVVSSKIAQVEATEGASNPDAYRHNGFHAKFLLGPGYASYGVSNIGSFDSLALSGTSYMLQLNTGFAIEENLILGANIGTSFTSEPNISASPDILTEKRLTGRTLGLSTWGPSLTYYTRTNYFMTAMVGAATAIYEDTRQAVSVKNGFASGLAFGREWWQSENFAMGISLNLMYSSITLTDLELLIKTTGGDVKDSDFRMSQLGVYLAFSVAYK
jgi:hypothetical protein